MNEMFLYRVECVHPGYTSKWYEKIGPAKAYKTRYERIFSKQIALNTIKFNLVTYKLVKV